MLMGFVSRDPNETHLSKKAFDAGWQDMLCLSAAMSCTPQHCSSLGCCWSCHSSHTVFLFLQLDDLENLNYDDLTAVAKLTSEPNYQSVMQVGTGLDAAAAAGAAGAAA